MANEMLGPRPSPLRRDIVERLSGGDATVDSDAGLRRLQADYLAHLKIWRMQASLRPRVGRQDPPPHAGPEALYESRLDRKAKRER